MDVIEKMLKAQEREPFPKLLGITCDEVKEVYARCKMVVTEKMLNIFGSAHGGAVFSLLDESFQLACNSHGKVAVALNLSITYVKGALPGDILISEVVEKSRTNRTAVYDASVKNGEGELVATGQALAYRKKEAPEFLR